MFQILRFNELKQNLIFNKKGHSTKLLLNTPFLFGRFLVYIRTTLYRHYESTINSDCCVVLIAIKNCLVE